MQTQNKKKKKKKKKKGNENFEKKWSADMMDR